MRAWEFGIARRVQPSRPASAWSSPYSGWIWCLLTGFLPSSAAASIMKPPYAIGSVPSLSGHAIAYRWRSLPRVRRHRASKPQGSSERVLPWQITMNQLIFASLSHTHYWYEVGMLKVPAGIPQQRSSCTLKITALLYVQFIVVSYTYIYILYIIILMQGHRCSTINNHTYMPLEMLRKNLNVANCSTTLRLHFALGLLNPYETLSLPPPPQQKIPTQIRYKGLKH